MSYGPIRPLSRDPIRPPSRDPTEKSRLLTPAPWVVIARTRDPVEKAKPLPTPWVVIASALYVPDITNNQVKIRYILQELL